jgi:hypothetical protein
VVEKSRFRIGLHRERDWAIKIEFTNRVVIERKTCAQAGLKIHLNKKKKKIERQRERERERERERGEEFYK